MSAEVVVAAYGAMVIWRRASVFAWTTRVPDEAIDIGTGTPASLLRPFCTMFSVLRLGWAVAVGLGHAAAHPSLKEHNRCR